MVVGNLRERGAVLRKLCRVALIISTAVALMAAVLWGVTYRWCVFVNVPLDEPDSYLSLDQAWGRVEVGYDHGLPRDVSSGSVLQVADARETWSQLTDATHSARSYGIDMKHPYGSHFALDTHAIKHPETGQMWTGWSVRFPHWLIVVLFGVWPTVRGIIWYRRRAGRA